MKIRKDLLDYLYFGIFGIFIVLFITGQFSSLTGTSLVVIDNADPNSMFPTYFQGDLFLIHKDQPTDISVGDVIVYENARGNRIIHRVVDIYKDGADFVFRVKGDDPVTNGILDPFAGGTLIPFESVLGKIVGRISHVGHISLAMQQNPIIQTLIYIIAVILVIAIIMWPTDEEEEEEEKHYNVTRETFTLLFAGLKKNMRNLLGTFTKSKYKSLAWLMLLLLLLSAFMPFIISLYLPNNSEYERGVVDISFSSPQQISENNPAFNVTFYNVFLTLFDDGNFFDHIESYTMRIKSSDGTIIDTTIWNTMRPILGLFTVGATITISQAIVNQLLSDGDNIVLIEVLIKVDGFFSDYDLDPFSTTLAL